MLKKGHMEFLDSCSKGVYKKDIIFLKRREMKKLLVVGWLLFALLCSIITISNFAIKVCASAPEVEGTWIADEKCGPDGWRCWQSPCVTCWCRDVSSGDCCNSPAY
jgi:hypothetical protein